MTYIHRLTMASQVVLTAMLIPSSPVFAQDTDSPSFLTQDITDESVLLTPEDDAILDEILSDIRETEIIRDSSENASTLADENETNSTTQSALSGEDNTAESLPIVQEPVESDIVEGEALNSELSEQPSDEEPAENEFVEDAIQSIEAPEQPVQSDVTLELSPQILGYADPNAKSEDKFVNEQTNLDEAEHNLLPHQIAIRDALARAELPAIVKRYYKSRDFVPIFTQSEALSALNQALRDAYTHALPAERYRELPALSPSANDVEIAQFELAALSQFLNYSEDMQTGILEPSEVLALVHRTPKAQPPTRRLELFVTAANKREYMRSLWPEHKAYDVIQAEFTRLTAGTRDVGAKPVSQGDTLVRGSQGPRVVELRKRLAAMGFPTDNLESPVFDEALYRQVIAFQRDRGIVADGIVGNGTIATLNYGSANKLRPLAIAMERFRWDNVPLEGRHIFVNIANFLGEIRDNNERSFQTRVVVGANTDDRQTPEFTMDMQYLVFNPYWWVPPSIAVNEYLPRLQSNPASFSGGTMEVYSRKKGRWIDPSGEDFSSYGEGNFPFTLRQKNGPNNALGKVKFMFPNKWNIYLHDTPAKSLFGHNQRAYSHGCVRVGDPLDLATALLSKQSGNPRGDISRYLGRESETYVDLVTPVPVHLTYFTTWVNNAGQIVRSKDVYGRDYPVYIALRNAGVAL